MFNSTLTWSNQVNVVNGKVYAMLPNLYAAIESTSFSIHMLLTKSLFIPILSLLYGCEIYANCDNIDQHKHRVTYNSIPLYVFRRSCSDYISQYLYWIFNSSINNLLNHWCRGLSTGLLRQGYRYIFKIESYLLDRIVHKSLEYSPKYYNIYVGHVEIFLIHIFFRL